MEMIEAAEAAKQTEQTATAVAVRAALPTRALMMKCKAVAAGPHHLLQGLAAPDRCTMSKQSGEAAAAAAAGDLDRRVLSG